ncbi:GspH/FimT family pseudopilin [Methyloversatilis sp.]|uniref:GspH/FimT family pseudopilin n=1 Tax=Methyloversatilis sp. TaxID=2569862 RepID=UPI0025D09164|nr:GspH/FimT family pseudopilin [Methyloversatilis sp.]
MDLQLMISARSAQHGFTLIELMIVVALLAIISAFALPAFQTFIASNRLTSEANELLAGLNLARSEAVRTQRRVVLCRATTSAGQVDRASGCVTTADTQPWQSWVVFIDTDADGVFDAGEAVLREQVITGNSLNLVSDEALRTAGNRIAYRPDGLARAPGSLALQGAVISVCDSSGSLAVTANARNVTLLSGSRVAVTRGGNASCGVTASVEEAEEAP